MARKRASYDGIVLVAPVTVPYSRFSTKAAHWWIGRAVAGLLERSTLPKDAIDGLSMASMTLMPDSAIAICQHLGLSPRWLDHIPMGGMSAVAAVRRAARAIQAGDAEVVACVGGDTNHIDSFRAGTAAFSQFTQDAVYPMGAGGPNESFAFLTDHYMRTFGATRADFGKLCVAQRANALRYEHALFKEPLTLDQYLAARPISEPIHLFDCVMPCAGADAFLMMTEERAVALGLPFVRLRGSIERHNAFPDDPVQFRAGWAVDCDDLYEQAGCTPGDIDFLETYDDYPVISVLQIEDLGFCAKGEGPDFLRTHEFTHDGDFPVNTSGGQLSVGQAGAAGAFLGMVEGIRQLLGEAEGRQVADARTGLVSGYGMIHYDRGLCSGAVILSAA